LLLNYCLIYCYCSRNYFTTEKTSETPLHLPECELVNGCVCACNSSLMLHKYCNGRFD
jgi:hypothetical protein